MVVMPSLCLAQTPPPVDVEVGSERASHPKLKSAHERAKKAGAYSLRVRYVKVEGRWAKDVALPIAPGDVLTPARIFDAMEALERAVTANAIDGYGLRSKGEVGVLYIEVEYDTSPPAADTAGVRPAADTVGVIFRPHYVHVSLEQIGDNVLPIPRSPRPTFFENVPKPLLALKPVFGVSQDRAFGTALGGAFDADLFNLRDPARISAATDENQHLDVHAQGMKSVDESFYRVDAGLRYSQRLTGTLLQGVSLAANYDGVKEPLGATEHTRNAGLVSGGVTLKLAPSTRLSLDTGYRRTDDTFNEPGSRARTSTSSDEQTNRALLDAIPRPIFGFFRAAVWEDNGWLSGGGSYQRMVGRIGYAKEIPVQPNQTIGLEVVAGGGAVLGNPPHTRASLEGTPRGSFFTTARPRRLFRTCPSGRSFGALARDGLASGRPVACAAARASGT